MDGFLSQQAKPTRKRQHDEMNGVEGEVGGADMAEDGSAEQSYSYRLSRRSKQPVTILLTSVQNLLSTLTAASHPSLSDLFANHTFVGYIDHAYSLIQHRTKLFLVHTGRLSEWLAYESVLRRFGHHPLIRFRTPVSIRKLIRMAMDHPSQRHKDVPAQYGGSKDAWATDLTLLLHSRAAMLKEYFALEIDDESPEQNENDADDFLSPTSASDSSSAAAAAASCVQLLGLPEIFDLYNPPLLLLPLFLLELARDCDWDHEQECFESVSRTLARFYRIQHQKMYIEGRDQQQQQTSEQVVEQDGSRSTKQKSSSSVPPLSWWVPHVFFPSLRSRSTFSPPATAATDGSVTQVASLENLYKIFERC